MARSSSNLLLALGLFGLSACSPQKRAAACNADNAYRAVIGISTYSAFCSGYIESVTTTTTTISPTTVITVTSTLPNVQTSVPTTSTALLTITVVLSDFSPDPTSLDTVTVTDTVPVTSTTAFPDKRAVAASALTYPPSRISSACSCLVSKGSTSTATATATALQSSYVTATAGPTATVTSTYTITVSSTSTALTTVTLPPTSTVGETTTLVETVTATSTAPAVPTPFSCPGLAAACCSSYNPSVARGEGLDCNADPGQIFTNTCTGSQSYRLCCYALAGVGSGSPFSGSTGSMCTPYGG